MISDGAPLSEWLAWLGTLSPSEIDLGLDRVQTVLGRLDLTPPEHVLLVAGTNGKGSCVAMATALLTASGRRVGTYTSPHILSYNERIAIDNIACNDRDIIAAFEVVESARQGVALTYFEFGTLAAVVAFAAQELDVWVLEVGLGGRLDATNAIEPSGSIITNVSLDHCDWLGHDIESIAFEKAGVMRAGKPTVFAATTLPNAIQKYSNDIGSLCLSAGRDFGVSILPNALWAWRGLSAQLSALSPPGLLGDFQIANAAAVLTLLEATGLLDTIDTDLVNSVLPDVSLPGRSQRLIVAGREWWIDVAHNPAAASALAATLAGNRTDGKTTAIIGVLDDKDVEGIIEPLSSEVDAWVAIAPQSIRALPADALARQVANLTGHACLIAASAKAALEFSLRYGAENDRILVTGSFFTVGPILELLATVPRPIT